MSARMAQTLGRARSLLKGFTPGQLGVIVIAGLALVLGAVGLTRWAAQPTWTPLFSNLSGADANTIVEQLRSENIQYELADGGSTVLVPQAQVYDLRVEMAGQGLPASDANSYSILDQQGLTATDFQQNVAYQRALESELNKTLQSIKGVQTAIVHVAMPQKDVFATAEDAATASVLLALRPGTTLATGEVRAVTHLVAGSIPGLDPGNVTVTDSNGQLLSTKDSGADGSAAAAGQVDAQTAQYEDRLTGAVQSMLDRVLGPGHAVARVNAQLDYDSRTTTSQQYLSATGIPPLSEATSHETYSGAAAANGGPLGQTYPTLTPGAGAGNGGTYDNQQRTVDNAVGSVVESAQAAPGSVQRLTVAVVLDSATAGSVDTSKITSMVGNAVGLDVKRGDAVDVSTMAFDTTAAETAKKEIADAQAAAKTAQYIDLGKKAGLALAALIIGIVLMRRRNKDRPSVTAYASDLPTDGGALLAGLPPALTPGPSSPALEMQAADPAELAAEATAKREQLRDEVTKLVENQPDDVAQVIQGWLSQRKG